MCIRDRLTSDSTITSNPHLFKSLSYDPVRDLVPVTQLINLVQLVVAHPALGASSIAELVTMARVKGSILNYASYGIGSQPHLLFEMLKKQTGIGIEQIPFKGIAPAVTAVIAGETQLTLAGSALVAGHLKSGRLKPLAVAGKTRQPSHPDLPTLAETGYAGIDPRSWFGLFAPAGTPPALIDRISKSVAAVYALPEFRSRYVEGAGHVAAVGAPAAFAAFIAEDMAYKKQLIAATGITAD